MKREAFFALLLFGWMVTGCSNEKSCDDTTGTFICFDEVYHQVNTKISSSITGSSPGIEITLTATEGSNTYTAIFSLWNTAFNTTPEAGSYNLVSTVPSSGGARIAKPNVTIVENGNTSYWESDNSGSSSLHSFTLTIQSNGTNYILGGRYTGSLKNIDNIADKKPVVVNFEDLSYTPINAYNL